jgi:hypothetical protein
MSQSVSSSTTAATFVVRFWRETTASGTRWRGSIEHVPSGEQAAFLEIDAMLSFLRRFGVTLQDQNQPTKAVQLRRTS